MTKSVVLIVTNRAGNSTFCKSKPMPATLKIENIKPKRRLVWCSKETVNWAAAGYKQHKNWASSSKPMAYTLARIRTLQAGDDRHET